MKPINVVIGSLTYQIKQELDTYRDNAVYKISLFNDGELVDSVIDYQPKSKPPTQILAYWMGLALDTVRDPIYGVGKFQVIVDSGVDLEDIETEINRLQVEGL